MDRKLQDREFFRRDVLCVAPDLVGRILVRRLPDGTFKVTGRLKDMIIRGGENIYPREIEELIYTHPAVQDVLIPKLWVQPVVENSVKYGSLRKQTLHVDLTARMEDGFLLLTVEDNGTGFEPQRLKEVQDSLTDPKKGTRQSGLQSIARRLVLLYGKESSVTIESEYMVHTRVTLRMRRGG